MDCGEARQQHASCHCVVLIHNMTVIATRSNCRGLSGELGHFYHSRLNRFYCVIIIMTFYLVNEQYNCAHLLFVLDS